MLHVWLIIDFFLVKQDEKWWPMIDFVGYQSNLQEDSKLLLQSLVSTQMLQDQDLATDEGAIDSDGSDRIMTAWDQYGKSGWGNENGCENRTKSFLEENTSTHKLETGNKLKEWYTEELETIVEDHWKVEWQYLNFPPMKLFQ